MGDGPFVKREETAEKSGEEKVREYRPIDLASVENALRAQIQNLQQALQQNEGAKNVSQKALEFEVCL